MAGEYLEIYRQLMAEKRSPRTVNGAAKAASHVGRHQTGMDGGLYVAD
jgi:hypothetical protein